VRKHYEFDVPRTATVRETIALFRANGAPSWMSDQKLAQRTLPLKMARSSCFAFRDGSVDPLDLFLVCIPELGLNIPHQFYSGPPLPPGVDRSPPIADDVLDKNAAAVRPSLVLQRFGGHQDNVADQLMWFVSLQCGLRERDGKFTFGVYAPKFCD